MTPENVRFHAAGHIAAAIVLTQQNYHGAASAILEEVNKYVQHDKVRAPQPLKDKVIENIKRPNTNDLRLLEQWFVDPFNSTIEKSQ